MAGLFGRSAAVRDKALADPQPYVPGMMPEPAFAGAGFGPPLPMRMNDDGSPPFGQMQSQPMPVPMNGGAGPGSLGDYSRTLFEPRPLNPAPVPSGPALDIPSNMFAAHIKPHFFDREGTGTKILGVLGDVALSYSASMGDPGALAQLRQMREQQHADAEARLVASSCDERNEALEDAERARNAPRYFSGKEDQLSYDPHVRHVSTIYDAPEEYQTYASAMGYQPGTPEYRGALSDYVLRGYGPTAAGVRSDLQQERFAGQAGLEGIRQGNRVALRGMPTIGIRIGQRVTVTVTRARASAACRPAQPGTSMRLFSPRSRGARLYRRASNRF
jgi:hypothetical protein